MKKRLIITVVILMLLTLVAMVFLSCDERIDALETQQGEGPTASVQPTVEPQDSVPSAEQAPSVPDQSQSTKEGDSDQTQSTNEGDSDQSQETSVLKTMQLTATDVMAVYDGSAHSVEVSCPLGEEAQWVCVYEDESGDVSCVPVDAGRYTATVTCEKEGYEKATATATVTIVKASVNIKQWPSVRENCSEQVFGTPLANEWLTVSELTVDNYAEYASVPGTFSWVKEQTLSVKNNGSAAYDVLFTPSGSVEDKSSFYNNYKTVRLSSVAGASARLMITVTKATPVLYGNDETEQNANKPIFDGTIKEGTLMSEVKLAKPHSTEAERRYGYVIGGSNLTQSVAGTYHWGRIDENGELVYYDLPDSSLQFRCDQTDYSYIFIPSNAEEINIVEGTLTIFVTAE